VTYAWILTILLGWPVFHEDRGVPEAKRAQLETVAQAVGDAADAQRGWPGSSRELAALMLTVAWHETHFSLRIGAGQCKPHECDQGRAHGYWQQHVRSTSSQAAWEQLAGLDAESTGIAAREAARALTRARLQCRRLERGRRNWVGLTLAAYAGRGCAGWFRGLDARVKTYWRTVGER
jgi:hypothetical protein